MAGEMRSLACNTTPLTMEEALEDRVAANLAHTAGYRR